MLIEHVVAAVDGACSATGPQPGVTVVRCGYEHLYDDDTDEERYEEGDDERHTAVP
jgi:hypothetical protein